MTTSHLGTTTAGIASVFLVCSGCVPPPGNPTAPVRAGGYVGTDRGSWRAWHDVMPAPERHSLHVEGTVTVSAGNYEAELVRRASTPETPHFDVRINDTGGVGAQVLTTRRVEYRAPYDRRHERLTVHFPDGESIRLPISRVH